MCYNKYMSEQSYRISTYQGFADSMIERLHKEGKIHGGNFDNILFYDKVAGYRVYRVANDILGPFATAQEFADVCEWNEPQHSADFVEEHEFNWPPTL